MPTLARPPIPPGLDGLVSLGMNQTKLAMLTTLARLGGSATSADLTAALPEVPKPTFSYHLGQLERSGYVEGSVPPVRRRSGLTVVWTLNWDAIARDLDALRAALRPADPADAQG